MYRLSSKESNMGIWYVQCLCNGSGVKPLICIAVNNGVYFCIDCSGRHRSIGVHLRCHFDPLPVLLISKSAICQLCALVYHRRLECQATCNDGGPPGVPCPIHDPSSRAEWRQCKVSQVHVRRWCGCKFTSYRGWHPVTPASLCTNSPSHRLCCRKSMPPQSAQHTASLSRYVHSKPFVADI